MQIMVELPESFLPDAGIDAASLSRQVIQDAAIGAYCRDAISKYELQLVLGLETRNQLDGLLKSLGVEHGAYSGEDLRDDLALFAPLK